LKRHIPLSRCLFEYATDGSYKCRSGRSLSLVQPITLPSLKNDIQQQRQAQVGGGGRLLDGKE
jgi:hypothetical protein